MAKKNARGQERKRSRDDEPHLGDRVSSSKLVKAEKAVSPRISSADTLSSSSLSCKAALLVVGSYQGLMIGLVLKGGKFYMKFSTKHHVGSVNCVALTERCIASCGTDERLFLFTNKLLSSSTSSLSPAARHKLRESGQSIGVRLADLGSLTPPSEVTCLEFASNSQFLFCGSLDGQLLVYRTRDWSVSAAMTVHERRIAGLAVHPASQGALVVTVGVDRMVAVLDIVKEKLITKWKYLSAALDKSNVLESKKNKSNKGEKDISTETSVVAQLFRREEPSGVQFSASGRWLLVHSANAFQLFESSSVKLALQYQNDTPQPADEMHSLLLVECEGDGDDVRSLLLVGDESGSVRCLDIDAALSSPDLVQQLPDGDSTFCRVGDIAWLPVMALKYPESVTQEAASLAQRPIQPDVECRRKNPLRHIGRIKSLTREGRTLFSLDSRGVVICWEIKNTSSSFSLEYVTSANCQGRATNMRSLWL